METLIRGKLVEAEKDEGNPFNQFDKEPGCLIEHRILGEYNLRYRNRESIMVVAASIEAGSTCHVCAPALSLFEFERSSSGWMLTDSQIAVTRWGQWGQVQANDVKVFVIGEDIYSLFLHGGGTGQGYTVSTISVQARIGDWYREILSLQTAEDDSGALPGGQVDWSSTIAIQSGTSGFYDLVVKRAGVKDAKSFCVTERFKFDGRKYTSSDLYR